MAVRRQPIPFGKYFLLDRINIGGMAEVWRAKTFGEQGFEKLVAIKRILPNIAEDDEFIAMFIDEAKITVMLTHANIAQVFDLGLIGDSYFIALEYVAGKDLRAIFDRCRKRNETAPIPMVCFMIAKMCEGLDYAHRKRDTASMELHIVHRDVSPQNCLVSFEGEIKVIDFGIAKAANKATKTQAGILKGKFGYMSPEQVRGLPLDQRSDVFAAGVVLYEMLTGERLFIGDSDFSVLEKVRQVDILPPTKYNRRIPEGLEKIVLKALAKDVEERYQFASDLADALQRFLIINDNIFSRKDLAQYMKSTFAEDVEKEKVRQAEYAEIKLPGVMPAMHNPNAQNRATAAMAARPAPVAIAPPPPPPPPPKAVAPPPPPPMATDFQETAPEVVDRTVIDGHDIYADRAAPPAGPPTRAVMQPPTLAEPEVEQILVEAAPHGNGASATGPEQPTRPHPAARPGPPVASSPARPAPAPRPAVGRPLPPNLGEPARPPPMLGQNPGQAPSPSTYKPRLPELEKVTDKPSRGSRTKWIVLGAASLGVALAAAAAAVYFGGSGGVILNIEPAGARVFVDGAEVCSGTSCVAKDLKAGKHRLEVRKERYETFGQDIDVPRGEFYQFGEVIKLKPLISNITFVVVGNPADAEIKIDGKVVRAAGVNGMYSGELTIGSPHEVVVSKQGYSTWKKTITPTVTDKPPITELAQLAPQALLVKFTSTPPGAKITIDGKARGDTPLTLEDLDPGSAHTVLFEKPCFKDATATLMVGGDPNQTVEKKLEKDKKPNCP